VCRGWKSIKLDERFEAESNAMRYQQMWLGRKTPRMMGVSATMRILESQWEGLDAGRGRRGKAGEGVKVVEKINVPLIRHLSLE
jgi:hypothetical protein